MKQNHQTPTILLRFTLSIIATLILGSFTQSFAYNVTNLKATYHNGQVFLTWTNPGATNLQYNVYRATTKFNNSSKLTQGKLIGFVRDNSAQNIHQSQIDGQDVFFRIVDGGTPLSPDQGLYVITCTDSKSYFYTVTVTTLSDNVESKIILMGKNSLSNPINETTERPLPVFQDSLITMGGESKLRYVQFVNNQETSLYPAMNSTGSYGFGFYISKRGNAAKYPLFVVYEGEGAEAGGGVSLDSNITNCYILGVDDWLPIPTNNGQIGDNSHYCCYHEKFNIYSNTNPIPTTGVVKTFPQRRYIQAIHWLKNNFPIDTSMVYLKGTSATGFAAILTSLIIPDEIAAVYASVEPVSIGTNGESVLEQMWGLGSSKLNTDILDRNTEQPLPFTKISDLRKMVGIEGDLNLPLIFDVHGKNDKTAGWTSGKIDWFDSLQDNHVGGIFYWDQRTHNGANKNFNTDETTPDFYRYQTTKSYPAFSNCSIDQDPGKGSPTSGDPYGAINGYLDWEDDITDTKCDYSVNVMVTKFYVGGVADPEQYTTCKTDITFRRLQNFHPNEGESISWVNYNNSNAKIQNGTITYQGGMITLKNITVNKSGNRIELSINSCQRDGNVQAAADDHQPYFTHSADGYTAHVDVAHDQEAEVDLYDLLGRVVEHEKVFLMSGTNTFEIPSAGTGIFLVDLRGTSVSYAGKLLF